MSELRDAANLIHNALTLATFYANRSGGAYRTVTKDGEIAVGADIYTEVVNVAGLPGEWGTVYESVARDLAAAFDIIHGSGLPEARRLEQELHRILNHFPSPPDIEAGRIDRALHDCLPRDATPADRMLWLVDSGLPDIARELLRLPDTPPVPQCLKQQSILHYLLRRGAETQINAMPRKDIRDGCNLDDDVAKDAVKKLRAGGYVEAVGNSPRLSYHLTRLGKAAAAHLQEQG